MARGTGIWQYRSFDSIDHLTSHCAHWRDILSERHILSYSELSTSELSRTLRPRLRCRAGHPKVTAQRPIW
jgi:hypothetical protein